MFCVCFSSYQYSYAQLSLVESVDNPTWRSIYNQPSSQMLYGWPGAVCASKMLSDPAPSSVYSAVPTVFALDPVTNNIVYRFWDTNATAFGYSRFGSGFNMPRGIVSFSNGDVYVSDTFNNRLVKLNDNANVFSFVSQYPVSGTAVSPLTQPFEMTTDSQGNIYVADSGNNQIQKFDRNLNPINQFPPTRMGSSSGMVNSFGGYGSGNGQLILPLGVAVNLNTNNIYVADTGNNRIEEFNPQGQYLREFDMKNSTIPDFGPKPPGPTYLDIDTCTCLSQKG